MTFSKGKYKTTPERLRGFEKTMVSTNRPKYEIHHLVMNILAQALHGKNSTHISKKRASVWRS